MVTPKKIKIFSKVRDGGTKKIKIDGQFVLFAKVRHPHAIFRNILIYHSYGNSHFT